VGLKAAPSQRWRATTVIQINTINLAWKGEACWFGRGKQSEGKLESKWREEIGKRREKKMRTWKMLGVD
jgi:hypothetical protein